MRVAKTYQTESRHDPGNIRFPVLCQHGSGSGYSGMNTPENQDVDTDVGLDVGSDVGSGADHKVDLQLVNEMIGIMI